MAPQRACRHRNYCADWLYGEECSRLPDGRGSIVNATRRAVDVNLPVTVRARPASAAAGAHQERYRPIDIDRSPGMIGSRRFNGERVLQSIRTTRKSRPLGVPLVRCSTTQANRGKSPHMLGKQIGTDFSVWKRDRECDQLLQLAEDPLREGGSALRSRAECRQRSQAGSCCREESRSAGGEAPSEERGHCRTAERARAAKKSQGGSLSRRWVPHDTHDQIVDSVNHWTVHMARRGFMRNVIASWKKLGEHEQTADGRKNLQRHEKPRDNRLTGKSLQVSLRRTGLCWEASRASERFDGPKR